MSDENKRLLPSTMASTHALELLQSRPTGVLMGGGPFFTDRKMVEKAEIHGVIFPWMSAYKIWWWITAIGAIFTVFFAPFEIGFQEEPGTFSDFEGYSEIISTGIFVIDIFVNFNLAFYKHGKIIFERGKIFSNYLNRMFWVDLIGVFPFETIVLLLTGHLGDKGKVALLASLLRMLRFVRLHRMQKLSDMLQFDPRVSLLWFTLIRNFVAVFALTHIEACFMYFLARYHDFGADTWLGPLVEETTGTSRYIVSLYWSIVTFCTVGYGDFAPANPMEQIWGSVFMLINVVVAAWIIGSITLLIVKGDERTGEYRDSLQTLQQYGEMNDFDDAFMRKLKAQLRLDFNNREISDEQVLGNFPGAVRRKILRKLYMQPLVKTHLMAGVRQQFVDAFLASCKVEIFNPGEEIVERGAILSDLFLLVGGVAEIVTFEGTTTLGPKRDSFCEEDFDADEHLRRQKLESGDFIGDIGFFTESPQVDSVACLTVCKTLTMTQASYKLLAQDHPSSVGKILQNLLIKVREMQVALPKGLEVLRAGSSFDLDSSRTYNSFDLESNKSRDELQQRKDSLTAVADLVKMHMAKQLDDQTTRLLFAASRGDTRTISLMCSQGFDADNADYDDRTALMVAAMKGNTDVVRLLLEYNANPNLVDMHGSTALLEAVKNGNDVTMKVLAERGAELCMSEKLAASVLCQAVYDGDISLLKRLLEAGIQVNAADYDKRTAAHIAAAEGNAAALRVLSQNGASLELKDRWEHTAMYEAKKSNQTSFLKEISKLSSP
ncbi:unnamed protein product [Cylindrotheca closterium]|uniref:Cyclic nucleotide-binding domain-containing protein n=1 Tax=Cylindrotheca closterium TaxID=2856 RepID=A0AAD2FQB1_9STRA|nr:unnamed protein product [Cylindrotheca closterium]